MRHLTRIVILTLWVIPALVLADQNSTDILLTGSKIGENVYEDLGSGKFTSHTKIEVAGTKIDSLLTGTWKDGTLSDFTLEEGTGQVTGRVVYKDGKASAFQGDKEVVHEKTISLKDQAIFAVYHLELNKSLYQQLRKNPDRKTLKLFDISALASFDSSVAETTETIEKDGKKVPIHKISVLANGITLSFAFLGDGKPVGLSVPSQNASFIARGWDKVFVDPVDNYPELSPATYAIKQEKNVKITLSDGVDLVADIVRPADDEKHPVILSRTPYGRAGEILSIEWLAKRGYVVIAQDVRGRGASTGDFFPLVNEMTDGKATLDWISQQQWCNGKVGMIGGSYGGFVQWSAAVTHHPALACIIPQVSPPDPTYNFPMENGARMLAGTLWWSRIVKSKDADMAQYAQGMKTADFLKMPITKTDDAFLGTNLPWLDKFLTFQTLDELKGTFTEPQVGTVKIPVLHISGVWDGDGIGTLLHWERLKKSGGNQWLIFGPWEHGFNVKTRFGGNDYGSGSILELRSVYLRFFDTYLKGMKAGWEKQPRAKVFVTGKNQWVTSGNWPPASSKLVKTFLSGGKAVGGASKGTLDAKPGKGKDSYDYDPNKIKPSQKEISVADEESTKIKPSGIDKESLLYRSSPLKSAAVLTGPMTVDLYVSTSAKDATFHVTVMDEDETGALDTIGLPGTYRLTYINRKFGPVEPGKVYHLKLTPWLFAHEFKKGHRIVLRVFSNAFPGFARNPGTGEPDATATKMVKAVQTIYKDAKHPSSLSYWVVP